MNLFDESVFWGLTMALIFGIVALGYGVFLILEAFISWICGNTD